MRRGVAEATLTLERLRLRLLAGIRRASRGTR